MAKLAGKSWAMDTLLGVAAHAALAFGLVAAAFLPGARLDLEVYLFGDILAVSRVDLAVIWTGAVLVAGLIAWRWRPMMTATLNGDLAAAEGHDPARERLILALALAVLVAAGIKVVGALLITAMLVIPALIGAGAAAGGLAISWRLDAPAGPSIVVAATVLLALALALRPALPR